MLAAPWYLFSFGIVLVVIGSILGAIFGPGASSGPKIDPRMKDAEIARRLRHQSSMTIPELILYLGLLCLLISVCWRLLRFFL